MAKENRRLSRENVQGFLEKTSDTGVVEGEALKEVTKARKRGFAGTLAVGGATLAGKIGRGANTIGGTLAEGVRAEVSHSDFGVRLKAMGVGMIAVLVVYAFMTFTPTVPHIERFPYDEKIKFRTNPMPESGSIVHLDLDDQTIATIERFPWKRSRWAGFVRACKEAGIRHTVFDIEFYQGQQEEVYTPALNEFRKFGDIDLPKEVSNEVKPWAFALDELLKKIRDIAEVLKSAETPEDVGKAREDLAQARIDLLRVIGDGAALKDRVVASELPDDLKHQFIERFESVIIDHDGLLAEAIKEVGNVILPMHFDKSQLVQATSGRPAVSKELFERYEAYLDRASDADLIRLGREGVRLALVGGKAIDEDREEIVLDDALASKFAEETFTNMRTLYLYRMVRKWYAGQSPEVLSAHMEAYSADWTKFLESLFAKGQIFERLQNAFKEKGFGHEWVSQAAEQLQRFYSWNHVTEDRAGRGHPWCYPISIIEGYDAAKWDPWAPLPAGGGHDRESGLIHYRDIGFVPAIYRLLEGSHNSGYVSIEHDSDGAVRAIPLFVVYEETFTGKRIVMPQLAFQTLLIELAVDPKSLKIVPGQYVEFSAVKEIAVALRQNKPMPQADWEAAAKLSGQPGKMATFRIKIDDRCVMRINWVGGNNPPFFEVFGHMPISRLIDIAATQDDIRKNKKGLEETLSARLLKFHDGVVYESLGGDAGNPLSRYFGQPPMQVASYFGSEMKSVPASSREHLREFVANEIRKALAIRADRLRLAEAEGLFAEDRKDDLKASTEQWAIEDGKALGEVLFAFGNELKRELGGEAVTEEMTLKEALLTRGMAAALAEAIAEGFEAVDGSPIDMKAPNLPGLAGRVTQDWKDPFRTAMIRLRAAKKLNLADVAEIQVCMFDASKSVADRGDTFEVSVARLFAVVEKAYGGPLDQVPEEFQKELAPIRGNDIGKLIESGKSLRTLLWSTDPAYGNDVVQDARGGNEGVVRAQAFRRLLWEVPLWAQAGILKKDAEIVAKVAGVAEHTWVKEGFGSTKSIPEDLNPLAIELLGFEEPPAALIARRIWSVTNTVNEANERFEAALTSNLESVRKVVGDRFALAGAAATGLGDIIVTPNNRSIPGPALHTNTYNTALYMMEPTVAPLLTFWIALLGGALVSFAAARLTIKWGIGSLLACLVIFGAADLVVYSEYHISLTSMAAILSWQGAFLSIQIYRYAVEYRAKLKIKGQFGKFLSQEAVEELQKNPDMLKLGGDEKELCVLFSDIAGFTPISESMSASRLIDFLNDYMGRMCASIKDNKGYVDKFIGDAIMAIWGAPVPVPDYSARAVKTAVRNTQSLAAWNRERKERGELEVGARIGLATGPMVAGNMGTEWKLNYTCIGDSVNLGARLEAANKQYGTQIMINELCYEQAKDVIVGHVLDKIAVKGKKKGLPVFHVVGLVGEVEPKYVKGCELYTQAFELYQAEKWAEAIALFKEAKVNLPPPYQVEQAPSDLMIERCEHLMAATPEERMEILHLKSVTDEWDGVWKLTSK